ncbi:efflux RND transporter periplasmic adaptor subunit [Xanthobacter dioxanivorans]|uniref:Efflux RND transporter periplasmic adaptor subunit n=1 Tax=Xanthobacter dioxanivorans TaxID=2528964 RepID=A0A974PSZ6_9HYPH|nr:efflux RND transporter periplasmic adaptor subunit [Xanthobacter dioxanivorans]QRG09237.1 efflux RND transporter periplasmic adaptor subunit [Xanthobacter dioxanivorans]
MVGGIGVSGGLQRGSVALCAALLLAACEEKNTYVPPPPPKVTVAPVLEQPVTRFLELTGNTAAINSVDLNARVQGFLTSINYKDGALARKGSVLFVIEQDQYKAQLDQAKATLAANQAAQVQAEAEYNRQAQLAKQDFASQATLDQARAKRDSAVADVANAQASLLLAQINLGYTEVAAPFDGAVTAHLQDVGALVGYSGPTKLATIVQLNPIWVWFTLSEQQVLRIKEHLAKDGRSLVSITREVPDIPIEIGLQTETGYPHTGRIDYIAPQVDPSLGTLTVRGLFQNDDFALLPGLFARVRVPLGKAATTLLVPDAAISANQLGPYVLTVSADNVVSQAQITLGQLQADGLRAVEGGLKSSDRIIINGIQRAVPGSKVDVEAGKIVGIAAPKTDDGSKPLPKPAGVAPANAPAVAAPSVAPSQAPTSPSTPKN